MKKGVLLSVMSLVCLLSSCAVSSEFIIKSRIENYNMDKSCSITGTMTDAEYGEPLGQGRIDVKGTDLKVFTKLDGTYEIRSIPPGKYELEALYIGYEKITTDTIKISGGEMLVIDFSLKAFDYGPDIAINKEGTK